MHSSLANTAGCWLEFHAQFHHIILICLLHRLVPAAPPQPPCSSCYPGTRMQCMASAKCWGYYKVYSMSQMSEACQRLLQITGQERRWAFTAAWLPILPYPRYRGCDRESVPCAGRRCATVVAALKELTAEEEAVR